MSSPELLPIIPRSERVSAPTEEERASAALSREFFLSAAAQPAAGKPKGGSNSECLDFALDRKASLPLESRILGEKLSFREQERLEYLQEQICNMRRLELQLGLDPQIKSREQIDALIAQERAAMQNDLKQGVFGWQTRAIYKHALNWLEEMRAQDPALHLEPIDSNELRSAALPHLSLAVDDRHDGISLGLNSYKLPGDADLDRLDAANKDMLERVLPHHLDRNLASIIAERCLPDSWNDRSFAPEKKRERAAELVSLAATVQEYARATDFFNRSGGKFPPLQLPDGCTFERDGSGNISKINLDLPGFSDLSNSTAEMTLKNWCKQNERMILQAADSINRALFDGPLALGESAASGRIKPDANHPEGQAFNLITRDYRVEEKDGSIVVTPSTKFWQVPFLSIHNTRKTELAGADDEARTYKPDDFLPVMRGGKMALIQAKDLKSAHDDEQGSQSFWRNVSIAADLSMSAAMILSGTAELAAAYRAYGLLSAGAAVNAGRALVGLSVALDNEGAKQHSLGRAVSEGRYLCFALESGNALLGSTKYFRGGAMVADAAAQAGTIPASLKELGFLGRLSVAAGNTGEGISSLIGLPLSLQVIAGSTSKWSHQLNEVLNGKHDTLIAGLRSSEKARLLRAKTTSK